ncbi:MULTISPECIES: hypothetical protein [unclassified Archaeoglobus]|jgi:hypothetical protein|uniref:hypothetical protein n=1 Tax=unclassified Archaeoglobus TaxID=2643606 RepID=UPI0025C3AFC9|nr:MULTISPECIES: hypothetical protein [unclassified Archaeoglobus]
MKGIKSQEAAKEIIVFLSHQVECVGKHPYVEDYFNELLFSVVPFYKSNNSMGFRHKFGSSHRLVYDSGGFQFLTGKLKNPDPLRTVAVYKKMGYTKKDILIQLDLPPAYYQSCEDRRKLIRKSAEFYHIMLEHVPVIPVVHGWTLGELLESLNLIEDPDRLALGTYHATTKDTNLLGIGTFSGINNSYEGPKHDHPLDAQYTRKIGLGVYAADTHPAPQVGNQHKPAGSSNGSNGKDLTPVNVIFERLATALNLLRDREVFLLGAANINFMHLGFLGGAKFSDGSSWRIAARFWTIYLPEHVGVPVGVKRNKLGSKELNLLREVHADPDYIFHDIPFDILVKAFKAHKKDGFTVRALHNAWVVKKEEEIANEFANDPDRYYFYLSKRWENSPYWRSRLNLFWKNIKQSWVQSDLEVFLRREANERARN